MNSMRLELMDEGSILWKDNISRSSPILIAQHPESADGLVLLQAVQMTQSCVDDRHLFSLESARYSYPDLPEDVELALASRPSLPEEFYHAIVRARLDDANLPWRCRECDAKSLARLMPRINRMLHHGNNPFEGHFVADETSPLAQGLVDLVNHPALEPLASLARLPWKPILWEDAAFLRSFDAIMTVLGRSGPAMSPRVSASARDELIDWLGAPSDDSIWRAQQAACSLWIPVGPEVLPDGLVCGHRYPKKKKLALWCRSCERWAFWVERLGQGRYNIGGGVGCMHVTGDGYLEKLSEHHQKALSDASNDPRGDFPGRWRDHSERAADSHLATFGRLAGDFALEPFTLQLSSWLFESANDDWVKQPTVDKVIGKIALRFVCAAGEAEARKLQRNQLLYHGTWWYGVRNLIREREIRGSRCTALGHDFSMPGVYTSPHPSTALEYGRAQPLPFSASPHRAVFVLKLILMRGRIVKNIADISGSLTSRT